MLTRSSRTSVIFGHPFELQGIDRPLPAGSYVVVTDEELIEGLSFPVYRRIATMMQVPGRTGGGGMIEMITIDPRDLEKALERDGAKPMEAPST